ncbi:LysR family glycine cleavage system transcriptional activator [Aeromonas sp. BIGb0405]|uniref:LysR substrate-binding domain-containing protein n=1 Tax=unclassified Aeromonas TaxID=257493 RepID=UPI002169900A|nr:MULTISPECIES: LysR substrate-binding domain-containing protein [unclassified Aeromonas]MCS3454061.1 LysR family glycine cleavage system transcriptional activator [Aeromonas sp. BIGb0405]MCS3459941.1 LysR family glycine cleavage system transcriptional activator [Aeromonas sp. BIGb0445]
MLTTLPRSQLPLYGLQVFECAARHLSFTLAADELCVSQGAVSKQIAQLEARLGHLLFLRGTRCLSLTPAAERLLPFVSEGLARMGEGLGALQTLPRQQAISIKVPSCASRWLLRRLQDFEGEAVEVRGSHSHGIDFAREPFDLAIVYQPTQARLLHSQPLFRERLTPICAPAFAAKYRLFERPITDLLALPLLHASADRRDWRNWFAAFVDTPWLPQGGQLFDTLDLAMNAALQGFGLSLGDPTIVAEELETGALVAPFAPILSTDHEYALLARPDSQRPGVREVYGWLQGRHLHP